MKVPEKYSYDKVAAIYEDLKNERSEWESDARTISDYLLPGRGIYQTYSKPRKRKLTSPRVINTIGEDSLYVLTSAIHSRLTSPAMPWFRTMWPSLELNQIQMLVAWLQQATEILHKGLHNSNFYGMINSFYTEQAGFGTGSYYVGEDTGDDAIPFRFELLTFGEYAFSVGANGLPDVYCRTIFMSKRQMVQMFGDTVSKQVREEVEKNQSGIDKIDLSVLEFLAIDPGAYQDKDVIRVFYEVTGTGRGNDTANQGTSLNDNPLKVDGFYEFPYIIGRWNTIGSDLYGIGPGSRAIPDIKRLQEMEKASLMATHKGLNPPLNAPAHMKGKLNTLPGGHNYYRNPAETVSSIYDRGLFDFQGVGANIERVEQRIQRNFFNDVFITASRDPNASPLRTGQVNAMKQEELFRLGPVTERLASEAFTPTIRRCFHIMHRKGMFPPLQPEFEEFINEIDVVLVSPMATAQNQVRGQGVDALMGFVANMAQFNPAVLDNVDADKAVQNKAEIEGVDYGVLRPEEEVVEIRQQRAKAEAQAKQQQEAKEMAGMQSGLQGQDATTRKTQAETGAILTETQATASGLN